MPDKEKGTTTPTHHGGFLFDHAKHHPHGQGAQAENGEQPVGSEGLKLDITAGENGEGQPLTPVDSRTPAEKVRFILADEKGDTQHEAAPEVDVNFAMRGLFCQMDVLCHFDDGDYGWKEAARWLKYEEKVEAGDRWSKPHVATTSLHSLTDIKKGLSSGTVMLDVASKHGCLHQVAENIVQGLAKDNGWDEERSEKVLDILLKPHKHKHRKGEKAPKISDDAPQTEEFDDASSTNTGSVQNSTTDSPKKKRKTKLKLKKRGIDDEGEMSALYHTYPGGIMPDTLLPYKPNKQLMKKIPGGAECASILIGQVDFLEEPVMAFARLSKSAILADLTEVAIPTRFIFVVLGPPESNIIWEYFEIGRAMAALMTDAVFCEVLYKASTSQDIVDGMEEFMDDLTVLPPSIWDPSVRLDPPETTISIDKIRARLMDSARTAAAPEAFHFAESAESDKSLLRTGRLFGGLYQDVKRCYSNYWSDITDGFHLQCLASIVFLYFACITPIVTFGGLLGAATDGYMGTMETLLAGAICGLLYHAFAGQPLTIVGATGPLLVFESILFQVCKNFDLSYLEFRFWIGAWVAIMVWLIVAFDVSALVRYITRFTEESFGVLISLIFIFEAFSKLAHIWDTHPIHIHAIQESQEFKCHCEHADEAHHNETVFDKTNFVQDNATDAYHVRDDPIFDYLSNWSSIIYEDCITHTHRIVVSTDCITEDECLLHGWELDGPACNVFTVTHSVPDVFFLSCFLFIGTFVIAIFFRNFRGSSYFPTIFRGTLSDFAVLMAIIICTAMDAYLGLDTPKLNVPDQVKLTRDDRDWVVNPLKITQWWLILLGIIPAFLATILVFLDQQITAVIVNRKENKLKKGHGYHLDMFVLGFLLLICSLLGIPWFVAATVRSVTHVRSLIKESELRAPGERPQFLGVREQRLTGLVIHLLIGVSVLLTTILKHIPMPVLYGVFLYMGVTSLSGVQFVNRILIMAMPQKYQPDYIFLRHVETYRVHIFTIIQIVCMTIMWVFKSIKSIAILFPLMVLGLCFIRKGMDYVFTQPELYWLDHILPDEHRRKKEDNLFLPEETAEDETKLDGDGYYDKNLGLDDVPLTGEWDQITAKRDYGLGRKVRPRRLSRDVIQRYKKSHTPQGGDIPEEPEEDDEFFSTPRRGFRERKFSI